MLKYHPGMIFRAFVLLLAWGVSSCGGATAKAVYKISSTEGELPFILDSSDRFGSVVAQTSNPLPSRAPTPAPMAVGTASVAVSFQATAEAAPTATEEAALEAEVSAAVSDSGATVKGFAIATATNITTTVGRRRGLRSSRASWNEGEWRAALAHSDAQVSAFLLADEKAAQARAAASLPKPPTHAPPGAANAVAAVARAQGFSLTSPALRPLRGERKRAVDDARAGATSQGASAEAAEAAGQAALDAWDAAAQVLVCITNGALSKTTLRAPPPGLLPYGRFSRYVLRGSHDRSPK